MIAFAALTSRFLFAAHFGFYEDDWLLVSASVNGCTHAIELVAATFPYRVLAWPLFDVIGCVVAHGGLGSAYILEFIVYVTLLFSIYVLLSLIVARRVALIAVIVFPFVPLDTTQALLAHVQLHVALLLMIIASICLVHRKLIWCAALTILSLLTYDAYLPVLFATGLIVIQRWREEKWAMLTVGLTAVSYLLFRQMVWNSGDNYLYLNLREPAALIVRIVSGFADLTANGISIPWFAVHEIARTSYKSSWILGPLISVIMTWIAYVEICVVRADELERRREYSVRRIVVAMLLMAAGSLAITASVEYYPQLLGRSGRYYTVASLSASVIFAIVVVRLVGRYARYKRAVVLACVFACVGLASTYGIMVQWQLAEIWRHQLTVIDSMFRLVPDLNSLVRVIVLDPDAFRNYGREAMSYTPPFAHLPQQMLAGRQAIDYSDVDARAFYRAPGAFLHLVAENPHDVLAADPEGRPLIRRSALSYYPSLAEDVVLQPADTIFIRVRDDHVERLQPFQWNGHDMGRSIPADVGRQWPGDGLTRLGAMVKERAKRLRAGVPRYDVHAAPSENVAPYHVCMTARLPRQTLQARPDFPPILRAEPIATSGRSFRMGLESPVSCGA